MVRSNCERCGLLITLTLLALPVAAHHSQAIYDRQNTITIEGVVTEYRWTNPHTYMYVEVWRQQRFDRRPHRHVHRRNS